MLLFNLEDFLFSFKQINPPLVFENFVCLFFLTIVVCVYVCKSVIADGLFCNGQSIANTVTIKIDVCVCVQGLKEKFCKESEQCILSLSEIQEGSVCVYVCV
uniref:Uncharacterized protein n=1 Tax=Octopus bimaculoides TaxID=37653 RepID=A0A0L8H891_OCTBM